MESSASNSSIIDSKDSIQFSKSQLPLPQSSFDLVFLRRLWHLLVKLHGTRIVHWWPLSTLFALCGTELVLGSYVGKVPGNFYKALIDSDLNAFYHVVWIAFGWIAAITIIKSLRQLATEWLAVRWRRILSLLLQDKYLYSPSQFYRFVTWRGEQSPSSSSSSLLSSPSSSIPSSQTTPCDNPDQRITQDTDNFTTSLANVFANLFDAPLVISFYTVTCFQVLGWRGIVAVYSYFLVGSAINKWILSPIVSLVFQQERLEGDLRFSHVWLRSNAESVALYRGHLLEKYTVDKNLKSVISNRSRIVQWHFYLNLSTNFFSYVGSILNYLIIAIPVFFLSGNNSFDHLDAGSKAMVISQASFACLMLISGFSTLLDTASQLSDLAGFTARVAEMAEVLNVFSSTSSSNPSSAAAAAASSSSNVSKADEPQDLNQLPLSSASTPSSSSSVVVTVKPKKEEATVLELKNVSVFAPFGNQCFLSRVSFSIPLLNASSNGPIANCGEHSIPKRQNLLVMGPSGCGKSSLIRILAGLWKSSTASDQDVSMTRPPLGPKGLFVVPQRLYLPPRCTLRQQVMYPMRSVADVKDKAKKTNRRIGSEEKEEEEKTRLLMTVDDSENGSEQDADMLVDRRVLDALEIVGLLHIKERLGGLDASCGSWSDMLSPGEQQRLALARVFFHCPLIVALDESTSSLPIQDERIVYEALRSRGIAFMSIGHRPSLMEFHEQLLTVHGNGDWTLRII